MSAESNGYRESLCGRYVMLPGGLSLPVEPILFLHDLQNRGFRLWRDGDDILVAPFSKLTVDDTRQLKLWKRFVLAILDYEPVEAVQ
jgi:hypothetical protein